jgi:hypothetical protein
MKQLHLRGSVRAWALTGVLAGLGLAAGLSCTPGSEITASESDIVATTHDKTFDFGAVTTYALADTIVHLTDDGSDSPLISRDFDDLVLSQVASRLDKLGWTSVVDPGTADVVVVISATATANFSYYYSYWGWYYPGYCPGCYWGYPTATYSYTTGTLLIQMFHPENTDTKVGGLWIAALNGVLDDSAANKQTRLTQGINQAFDQSPYLAGE